MYKKCFKVGYDISSKSAPKYGRKKIPFLRFTGMWLTRRAGLSVGDKVMVLAEQGKMAILKIEKGATGDNADISRTK